MIPAGFEPAIPQSERPPTQTCDCAATGTGNSNIYLLAMDFNDTDNCGCAPKDNS
jgi:hypothetical protein